MVEKGERSKRIIEGIVPVSIGGVFGKGIETERSAKIAQGMRGKVRPGGTGQLEGIDPGTEGMARKGAEEAFLGAVSVGYHGATSEG